MPLLSDFQIIHVSAGVTRPNRVVERTTKVFV